MLQIFNLCGVDYYGSKKNASEIARRASPSIEHQVFLQIFLFTIRFVFFCFFATIEYIITKMKQNRQRNLMAINLRTNEKERCSVVVMTITNKRMRSAKNEIILFIALICVVEIEH